MTEKPSASEDFYNFINYEWLKENPIPNEYTKWGNFHVLHEQNQSRLREMLESEASTDEQKKLNILWNKGLDAETLNKEGHMHLVTLFDKFKLDDDFDTCLVSLLKYNFSFLFDMEAYTDFKDSTRNVLYFDVMGLGLPDRDYYLLEKMQDKRDKYKEFLQKFLNHFKLETKMEDVYNFEEEVAKIKLSKAERRDPKKIYNEFTFDKLKEDFPGVCWDLLFKEFNIPTNDKIIITEPTYFTYLSNLILDAKNNDNMSKLKNFFKYKLVKSACSYVDDETYDLYFEFYGKDLFGQKEPKQRWKRVLSTVEGILGEVLSKSYVDKYFSEDQKLSCTSMIKEIVKTYESRIKNLDWMSEVTKTKALDKLNKFNVKIGYPDKWTDFSKLNISESLTYYENMLESFKWSFEHNFEKLYKPVDKLEWHMNAHDINAYYSPTMNEIVFPAGILQEPFYSASQSLAENLGGIGAVIGHEITHGFDDKGRLYDLHGNLNDWWTEDDAKNFDERSKKLEELFNSFSYFGLNVNGKLTLGENIADLGGITLSLKTIERLVEPENYKNEMQKLFEQWAKVWRCNITEDTLKNQLLTDPHSPTQLRVNGILCNLDEFYETYNIKEGDKMYVKPELRSKIW